MTEHRPARSSPWWDRVLHVPHDRIFISYRREDGEAAWWLAASLRAAFLDERVFMDTRDIEPSRGFAAEIESHLRGCSVVLAVIGPAWKRRIPDLYDEQDWVRQELQIALGSGSVVIPVLIGVKPADLRGLPPALDSLLNRQAVGFAAVAPGLTPSDLHEQWEGSLRRMLTSIRKSRFRREEIRAALIFVSLLSLTVALLVMTPWVYVAPLYAAMYIGANWPLFAAPIAFAGIAFVIVTVGVFFAPHTIWSQLANLARHTPAIPLLVATSIILFGTMYVSRPLAMAPSESSPENENPCDGNYQVQRFGERTTNGPNPCEVDFKSKLTLIEMRTRWSFSTLAKAKIDISVVGGDFKAIRVPHAMTISEDAQSRDVLSLSVQLTRLQNVSTPFVIWVATEPAGKPVAASLTVGENLP